jgi:hypothetical protein
LLLEAVGRTLMGWAGAQPGNLSARSDLGPQEWLGAQMGGICELWFSGNDMIVTPRLIDCPQFCRH